MSEKSPVVEKTITYISQHEQNENALIDVEIFTQILIAIASFDFDNEIKKSKLRYRMSNLKDQVRKQLFGELYTWVEGKLHSDELESVKKGLSEIMSAAESSREKHRGRKVDNSPGIKKMDSNVTKN